MPFSFNLTAVGKAEFGVGMPVCWNSNMMGVDIERY
jgi:hypothetical protein